MGFEPAPRIEPVAPGPSLLTSARPLPNVTWVSGIGFGTGCQPSHPMAYCPIDVDREDAETQGLAHLFPFWIYTPLVCNYGAGAQNLADLPTFAEHATETHTAAGIASTLWMGTGYADDDDTSPTLRNAAEDVAGAAAVQLDDGVAQLLAHYELATGGEGGALIHLPSTLSVYALGGGAGGARLCWPEGTFYRGPLGSVFVPGPGYPLGSSVTGPDGYGPGSGDNSTGHYAGNAPGESWVYVSGPVEYAVGAVEVVPENERDRTPPMTNLYEIWGQRPAIVRFDPCKVFATKVINPAPTPEIS